MNKFFTLFVLSALMLEIQSSAMEVVKFTDEENAFVDKYGKKNVETLSDNFLLCLKLSLDSNKHFRKEIIQEFTLSEEESEKYQNLTNGDIEKVYEKQKLFIGNCQKKKELSQDLGEGNLNKKILTFIDFLFYSFFCKKLSLNSDCSESSEEYFLFQGIVRKGLEESQIKRQKNKELSK